jgi:hypothetical protein
MNKILQITLLLALAAYGQQQERIAIMGTVDTQDSIEFSDLSYLTNKLRDIAGDILPKNRYGIMTQQSIVDRLGSQERMVKECKEATCLADLGRKISADYIAQGYVGRFSGELTIMVELYRVGSGNLIGSFSGDSKDLKGLLAVLEVKAPKLFKDMVGVSSTMPEKPAPPAPLPPPPVLPTPEPPEPPPAAPVAKEKKCASKFNINELVSKISSGFPGQLKDCSATLAKNMALAASPFGKKTELKEPKAFMTECVIDGIKQKLPLGSEEYVKPVESFVQNILNLAVAAGGGLDVKKLSSAIGGMNVNELINELKEKAANDDCVTDEPYEPPVEDKGGDEGEGSEDGEGRKILSLGFRTGFNFSHLYVTGEDSYGSVEGSYNSTPGFQIGLVLDIAVSDVFHIQPGVMYIQKGAEDKWGDVATLHYIEIPLLLSLKFSAFRVNAGPYFSVCLGTDLEGENYPCVNDHNNFGISTGLGFDIERFYIGTFYDYDFFNLSNRNVFRQNVFYSRTLGFNFGVNL